MALCTAAASTAAFAQDDARKVETGYEITFAGFTGFRIDFTGRFNGAAYDVASHTFKEGLLSAVAHDLVLRGLDIRRSTGGGGSLMMVDGDRITLDDVEAYAYFRIGYHRGLDSLRQSGWRGSGYVRWRHETNRGFLRALAGLQEAAAHIGENDEAERCAQFLVQLALERLQGGFTGLDLPARKLPPTSGDLALWPLRDEHGWSNSVVSGATGMFFFMRVHEAPSPLGLDLVEAALELVEARLEAHAGVPAFPPAPGAASSSARPAMWWTTRPWAASNMPWSI